ncbi:MAG TPA: hypothetical protein VL991_12640 [Terracidiphilus sp.]|nr:hypothetical protein [Terracidiphilus sp.]
MSTDNILAQIDAEIARLTRVRSLLASAGNSSVVATKGKKTAARGRKRVLSPEARKRIADAQRKRWAAQRAKSKGK